MFYQWCGKSSTQNKHRGDGIGDFRYLTMLNAVKDLSQGMGNRLEAVFYSLVSLEQTCCKGSDNPR